MRRMLLGFLAGLIVWRVLEFLLLVTGVYDFVYPPSLRFLMFLPTEGVPVLLAGGVAGYIAQRRGVALGCIIGAVPTLLWLPVIIWQVPELPAIFGATFMFTKSFLLPGIVGGFVGELLVRRRLRPSIPLD